MWFASVGAALFDCFVSGCCFPEVGCRIFCVFDFLIFGFWACFVLLFG